MSGYCLRVFVTVQVISVSLRIGVRVMIRPERIEWYPCVVSYLEIMIKYLGHFPHNKDMR